MAARPPRPRSLLSAPSCRPWHPQHGQAALQRLRELGRWRPWPAQLGRGEIPTREEQTQATRLRREAKRTRCGALVVWAGYGWWQECGSTGRRMKGGKQGKRARLRLEQRRAERGKVRRTGIMWWRRQTVEEAKHRGTGFTDQQMVHGPSAGELDAAADATARPCRVPLVASSVFSSAFSCVFSRVFSRGLLSQAGWREV